MIEKNSLIVIYNKNPTPPSDLNSYLMSLTVDELQKILYIIETFNQYKVQSKENEIYFNIKIANPEIIGDEVDITMLYNLETLKNNNTNPDNLLNDTMNELRNIVDQKNITINNKTILVTSYSYKLNKKYILKILNTEITLKNFIEELISRIIFNHDSILDNTQI